jgi:hypothetical protein
LEQTPVNALSQGEEVEVPAAEHPTDLREEPELPEKEKNDDQNVKRGPNSPATHWDEFLTTSLVSEKTKAPDDVPVTINTVIVPTATPEKANSCLASPDDVRKETLSSWGIPAREVPEVMRVWCSKHRQGKHDICKLFLRFRDELVNEKIPFSEAKRMLEKGIFATEKGLQTILQDLTQERIFKPWENTQSEKAYIADFEDRTKPEHEAIQKHLTEIENLLTRLNDILRNTKTVPEYSEVLKVEKDPIYPNMIEHCATVAMAFRKFELDWRELQSLNSEKISAGDDIRTAGYINNKQLFICEKKVKGSGEVLRKAVYDTLKNKWFQNVRSSDYSGVEQ